MSKPKTIFYSWQMDRSGATGRNFVRRALEDAIKQIAAEDEANVEDAMREDSLSLDSDTSGVPGSPPIVETIFKKIEAASVFVADLTFVGTRGKERPTPNPNVAIEYGFALRALTHARIVGVMNAAYGEPSRESLPFDLGHMRFPVTYNCPEDADDATKKRERAALTKELKGRLRDSLAIAVAARPAPEKASYVSPYDNADASRFRPGGEPIGVLDHGRGSAVGMALKISSAPGSWLRLMPKFAPSNELLVMDIREALMSSGRYVTPLNAPDAMNPYGLRGSDGYGFAAAVEEDAATLFVFVLQSGEVWSIDAKTMTYHSERVHFDPKEFVRCMISFGDLLARLGVEGPYRWVAGMHGVLGKKIWPADMSFVYGPRAAVTDRIVVEGEYSGDPSEAPAAIEPFIRRVFDAAGLQRKRG